MDLSYSSTAMNFTENQQGSTILDKLRLQKDVNRFCDAVFNVNSKQYQAHRCVLAASSPYFETMLKNNSSEQETINVSCENNNVFEVLLNYVYTGKVVIDGNIVTELLQLSDYFMMTKLKEHCCEYMERSLNVTNCFAIREQAKKCGTLALSQTVDYFIASNIHEIVKQCEITQLSLCDLEMFLRVNYNLTEDQKVRVVLQWVKYNIKDRETYFRGLLSGIHWHRTNMSTVYDLLKCDDLFTISDKCFFQLLQVLEENKLLGEQYFDTYALLKGKVTQVDPGLDPVDMIQMSVPDAFSDLSASIPDTDVKLDGDKSLHIMERINNVNTVSQCWMEDQNPNMSSFGDSFLNDSGKSIEDLGSAKSGASQSPSSANASNQSRHKRKGIPVKVKLPKSKLKSTFVNSGHASKGKVIKCKSRTGIQNADSGAPRLARRRGRPPKKYYSDQLKEKIVLNQRQVPLAVDDQMIVLGQDGAQNMEENGRHGGRARNSYPPGSQVVEARRRGRRRNEKVKCSKCFYVTTSSSRLSQHIRTAHKDDTTYSCRECNFKCKWNREYYQHMRTHFPGPPYKCDFADCDYVCDRVQPLLYHRMIHTDERPFQCTVCNVKFRTKNNLTTHLRCHTGVKPYKCEVCGKCFATKGTLEQHTVTHSDDRPYLCDTCGFSTKYQSHLVAHKRIHTGDVYRCQYENCNYTTPKKSQLAAHMRIHLSIREHICNVCGRSFVEKSHLVRHERIHLQEKPFKCSQCAYRSTRRDKLKEHVEKHHGENSCAKTPYKPRKPRKQSAQQPSLASEQPIYGETADYLRTQQQPPISSQDNSLHMMTSTLDTRSLGLMLPGVMNNVPLGAMAPSASELCASAAFDSRVLQNLNSTSLLGMDSRSSLDGRTSVSVSDGRMSVANSVNVSNLENRNTLPVLEIRSLGESRNQLSQIDLRTSPQTIDQMQVLDNRGGLSADQMQLHSQALQAAIMEGSPNQSHLSLHQQTDAQHHADLTNLSAFMGMF